MLVTLASLTNVVIQLAILYGLDCYLHQHHSDLPPNIRWCLTHTWGNILIMILSGRQAVAVYWGLVGGSDLWQPVDNSVMLIVAGLHLIHLRNYQVSSADLWHHVMYVATFCPILLIWNWGLLQDALAVVMCGLPGAIDYASQVLVHYQVITVLQQNQLNCYVNLYLRSPLFIAAAYLVWSQLAASPNSVVVSASIALALYNTQSHTMAVIEQYYQARLDQAKLIAQANKLHDALKLV